MATQTQLYFFKNNGSRRRVQENFIQIQTFWEVSRPVLEDWLQDLKGPKASTNAIDTSTEILKDQIFRIYG